MTRKPILFFAFPALMLLLLAFSPMIDFSGQNSLMLCLGLAACAYCHVAFLREARLREQTCAIRILALQRDL